VESLSSAGAALDHGADEVMPTKSVVPQNEKR